MTKSALKDVPPLAARLLSDCQPLTLLASRNSEQVQEKRKKPKKYIKFSLAVIRRHLLLEGLNSLMGLEKYNAAPRVSDRATAEYTGFVVPRPSGSWSWSSDSFDILSHARSSRPKLAFSRDKRVAACRCAMCARVNPRSGTRKERHKGKPTEPFATQARKYPRSAFRCNPRSLTYPPSTSDTPHTTRTFFFFFQSFLQPTHLDSLKSGAQTTLREGGTSPYALSQKCIAALAASFLD